MESFWATFRLDPRLPRNAPLRASDADREVVRDVLGDAFADGRLNREEYDERVTTLFETRTLGELPALVDDLVDPEDPPAEPARPAPSAHPAARGPGTEFQARAEAAYRKELSGILGTFLLVAFVTWTIWLSGGVNHFAWPIFPSAIFGANLAKTVRRREETIDREIRRLQRKQARADAAARDQASPPVRLEKPDPPESKPEERPEDDG